MGYLPQAILSFLARLGWSHGDQEIFTVEELCKYFALDKIGISPSVFNPEKLDWMSGHFMKDTPAKEIASYMKKYFAKELAFTASVEPARFERGIAITQAKVKKIVELIDQLHCLFGADPTHDTASLKPGDREQHAKILSAVLPDLEASNFSLADLETRVRARAEAMGLKLSPFAQGLRFAVTGGKVSPGLFEMLEVQGKEVVLRRVKSALRALNG
jgi:glutamyl-tRNA synthetase